MENLLTLPGVLIALLVTATLGGWVGWMLAAGRAGSRRRGEEAWESEVVRAAGCARDRAVEDKEQMEQRLDRLQKKHARCDERMEIFEIGTESTVELDRCPKGCGLWFDRGEMKDVIAAFGEREGGAIGEFFAEVYRSELEDE